MKAYNTPKDELLIKSDVGDELVKIAPDKTTIANLEGTLPDVTEADNGNFIMVKDGQIKSVDYSQEYAYEYDAEQGEMIGIKKEMAEIHYNAIFMKIGIDTNHEYFDIHGHYNERIFYKSEVEEFYDMNYKFNDFNVILSNADFSTLMTTKTLQKTFVNGQRKYPYSFSNDFFGGHGLNIWYITQSTQWFASLKLVPSQLTETGFTFGGYTFDSNYTAIPIAVHFEDDGTAENVDFTITLLN